MSKLSITKPEIGKPDSTEDVKIVNALAAIEVWGNALIGNGAGVPESELAAAVQTKLNAKTSDLNLEGRTYFFKELTQEEAIAGIVLSEVFSYFVIVHSVEGELGALKLNAISILTPGNPPPAIPVLVPNKATLKGTKALKLTYMQI